MIVDYPAPPPLGLLNDLGTNNDDRRETSEKTMNEKLGFRFRSTQDIIDAAYAGRLPDKIMITVHPQRWSACPVKLISLFHGDSFLAWGKELV